MTYIRGRERGVCGVGWTGGLEPTLFEQRAPKLEGVEGVNGSNKEPTLVNICICRMYSQARMQVVEKVSYIMVGRGFNLHAQAPCGVLLQEF